MNDSYVSVPVPQRLVPEVMAFIVQRQSALAPSDPPAHSHSDPLLAGQPESRLWTEQEFARLARAAEASADRLPSVRKFAAVLSALAEVSPAGRSVDELARDLGTSGRQLQNSLGPFTRWMRNHISDDARWPIVFIADEWVMPQQNVARWLAAKQTATGESDLTGANGDEAAREVGAR